MYHIFIRSSVKSTRMDCESIILSEINQTENDKNHMVHVHAGNKTERDKRANKLIETDDRVVVTRGDRGGGRT